MVIQSSLPFEVTFTQMTTAFSQEIPLTNFYLTEKEAYGEIEFVKIRENRPLRLTFEGHQAARFYMSGLDALPERVMEIDDNGEAYLNPCTKFDICKPDYYPLIPGRNLITVVSGDQSYFTIIEIIPSQITMFQWESMVEDLEQILKGLSMDLILKNLGVGSEYSQAIPTELLYKFMIIQKSFSKVMASLSDLLNRVNHRIRKEYRMEPIERTKITDEVTIRYKSSHPEEQELLKVPKLVVDYDLPENRWVKHIVKMLSRNIGDFIIALDDLKLEIFDQIESLAPYAVYQRNTAFEIKRKEKVLIHLDKYREVAEKMLKGFQILRMASWYESVSEEIPHSISPVLLSDSRYFALYRLYKELQKEDFEVELDPTYAYQRKRTDKLYEIWGFLKVCDVLKRLEFKPMRGWIYDTSFDIHYVLIPNLASGTMIVFQKEKLEIRMYYDGRLPYESKDTSLDNPLYAISGKNAPDGKMDVYREGVYIGSVLFDMKYRKLQSFFQDHELTQSARSVEVIQLSSYTQCRSKYTFGITNPIVLESITPVDEVWAIYPTSSAKTLLNKYISDHKLRFLRLAPGLGTEHLEKQLEETIDKLIQRYEQFKR